MKLRLLFAAALAVISTAAHAQTSYNITGATAFRTATINSIINGYGGLAACGVVHSGAAGAQGGANAISFFGTFAGLPNTTIRCRFSGATEGIRDLVGTTVPGTPNDVFYYPDALIPAIGTITALNQNSNPVGANVALKPDVAFSDVQQTNSPYRTPVLGPADSRVGVVTFVFCKSEGSSANLTNVTAQAWRATLASNRGVPLNVYTGLAADQSGRVLATGRNDGSGTRAVYLIESGYGVSRLVNQFKLAADGFNGVGAGVGGTAAGGVGAGGIARSLQLWPANDAQDANNNSVLWQTTLANGNGGYFSSSNTSLLLQANTSSVRVLGPGGTDLPASGSYTPATAAGSPRAISVVGFVGTNDGVTIAANGGGVLAYNGVLITPVATGVDPTGLVPADRYKVTNGSYTMWSYERLYSRGTLSANQTTIDTALRVAIPGGLATNGIAISAMTAVRTNDGDIVTQP